VSSNDPTDWRRDVLDLSQLADRWEHLRTAYADEGQDEIPADDWQELQALDGLHRQLARQAGGGLEDLDRVEPALIWEGHYAEYVKGEHAGSIDLAAWPFRYIDWEAAAKYVRSEYVEVVVAGRTWLVRSL